MDAFTANTYNASMHHQPPPDKKREAYDNMRRKMEENRKALELAEQTRQLTPAEREGVREIVRRIGAELRAKGIVPDHTPGKEGTCVMCLASLSAHTMFYCSGTCMSEAKASGVYGHECDTIIL